MTREELKEHCIKQVEQCEMWAIHRGEEPSGKIYEEHKAILDILEQEPCEDTISREAVLDEINRLGQVGFKDYNTYSSFYDFVEGMPPVESSRPCDSCKHWEDRCTWLPSLKGHWIDADGNTVKMIDGVPQDSCWCSECKEWLVASDEYSCKGYYCSNCGVEMENIE